MNKQLQAKLKKHKFTVVSVGQGAKDPDVIEFKARQKQAQARAKRREETKRQTTLACKLEGIVLRKAA